jgi:hypothetical protein
MLLFMMLRVLQQEVFYEPYAFYYCRFHYLITSNCIDGGTYHFLVKLISTYPSFMFPGAP